MLFKVRLFTFKIIDLACILLKLGFAVSFINYPKLKLYVGAINLQEYVNDQMMLEFSGVFKALKEDYI